MIAVNGSTKAGIVDPACVRAAVHGDHQARPGRAAQIGSKRRHASMCSMVPRPIFTPRGERQFVTPSW
jgi:hypothetical protein